MPCLGYRSEKDIVKRQKDRRTGAAGKITTAEGSGQYINLMPLDTGAND